MAAFGRRSASCLVPDDPTLPVGLPQEGDGTFRFIEEHRGQWPVRRWCETLAVSTAGYYAWRVRPVSAHGQRRAALVVAIRAIHAEVKARYGSPRIQAALAARGQP